MIFGYHIKFKLEGVIKMRRMSGRGVGRSMAPRTARRVGVGMGVRRVRRRGRVIGHAGRQGGGVAIFIILLIVIIAILAFR